MEKPKITTVMKSNDEKDLNGLSVDSLISSLEQNKGICGYFICNDTTCSSCILGGSIKRKIEFLKGLKKNPKPIPIAKYKPGDLVNKIAGGYYYSDPDTTISEYNSFKSFDSINIEKIKTAFFSIKNNQWWYKFESLDNWHTESALCLSNLIEEAKKRYPIGTRFTPPHLITTVFDVTNESFVQSGDVVFSLDDEGNDKGGPDKLSRIIYQNNRWAKIIEYKPVFNPLDRDGNPLVVGKTYIISGTQVCYIGCKNRKPYFEHNKTSVTGVIPDSRQIEDLKSLNWVQKGSGKIWSYEGLEKEAYPLIQSKSQSVESNLKPLLYTVKPEDLIKEIKDIPIEIVQKMINYQFEQNGYCDIKVFQQNKFSSKRSKGFDWELTEENAYWSSILKGQFKYFYKYNPKDYFNKNGEKLIIGDKYIDANDIFYYCGSNGKNILFEGISGIGYIPSSIEDLKKEYCFEFKEDKQYYLFINPDNFLKYNEEDVKIKIPEYEILITNPSNEIFIQKTGNCSAISCDFEVNYVNKFFTNSKGLKFGIGSIVKAKGFSNKFDDEPLTIISINNEYCGFKESENIPSKFHINNVYEVIDNNKKEELVDTSVLIEEFERTPIKPFEFIKY